jgi:DNA-binding XRE family transcriptional regulator
MPLNKVSTKRNIKAGQDALARAMWKMTKPGVVIKRKKDVPLYYADPNRKGIIIRELNGKRELGIFKKGKFKIDNRFKPVIVKILLYGPKDNESSLLEAAKNLGYNTTDSIHWREAFSEFSDEELPGVALSGARIKEGLTQKKLAERLRITQGHVSEMERGKRSIDKAMAKKIATVLNVDYRIFL